MVRIYKNGEKYQGKVVWLKEPTDSETGKPKLDKFHPDESSRTRPILGLVNVWGFSFKDRNIWEDGNIYDPKNGNTYSCSMKMTNANAFTENMEKVYSPAADFAKPIGRKPAAVMSVPVSIGIAVDV